MFKMSSGISKKTAEEMADNDTNVSCADLFLRVADESKTI